MEPNLAPRVADELSSRWEPMYRSQLHYLASWWTRGRRPVLRDRHASFLHQLVQQICDERGYTRVSVAVESDRIHVLVALRPSQSVASVIREIKGRSATALMSQFPELRVWLRGNLAWDERYAVETVSGSRVSAAAERLRALNAPHEELARAS